MPLFAYIALKNNKTIVRGKIEADDVKSAREGIKKQGIEPLDKNLKKEYLFEKLNISYIALYLMQKALI